MEKLQKNSFFTILILSIISLLLFVAAVWFLFEKSQLSRGTDDAQFSDESPMSNVSAGGVISVRPPASLGQDASFAEIASRKSILVDNSEIRVKVVWAEQGPLSLTRQSELSRGSRENLPHLFTRAQLQVADPTRALQLKGKSISELLRSAPSSEVGQWLGFMLDDLDGVIARTQLALNSPRPIEVVTDASYPVTPQSFSQPDRALTLGAAIVFHVTRLDPDLGQQLFKQLQQDAAASIKAGLTFPVDVDVSYGLGLSYERKASENSRFPAPHLSSSEERQRLVAWLRNELGLPPRSETAFKVEYPIQLTDSLYRSNLLTLPATSSTIAL